MTAPFDPQAFVPILRDFVSHPLLFASVSGAHLYGFDSPDSDVDLRGCHILPVADFIGLDEPRLTLDRMAVVDGVEVDLVSHDLKKYVTLLIRQNGNYLEQLFSPLMVVDSPQADELRHLVRQGNIARHVYHAYAAYAKGKHQEWRADALKGEGRLKPLLYAYRVSLTGVHLLRTGEVNASLADLAPVYGYGPLLALIAAKSAERIAVALPVDEHDQALSALQEELRVAYETSPLPNEPQNRAALNDFVVRVRLELGGGVNWVERHTILKVLWGSQAFGTAGPQSDTDVRGVCIPPARYLIGLANFDQYEDAATDTVIYSLAKFVTLALANNPNMLDILWADPRHVLYADAYGQALQVARSQFLSRRVAKTYAGYADDQMKRMETHYRWLHNPPDHQPSPHEYGAERHPKGGYRFPNTHQERAYRAALTHWQNYVNWRANRNPERSALEERYGYDTKHAAHLLRLYRMGIEILCEHVVRVLRPDAAWLMEVREGRYTYPELMALVADLRAELARAEAESTLPAEPDTAAIEQLVIELHRRALGDVRFGGQHP